jgi:hypothetical protein
VCRAAPRRSTLSCYPELEPEPEPEPDMSLNPNRSTLSFCWSPEREDDLVYFAMCYPYTYTEQCRHLDAIEAHPLRARHVRRELLAHTLAGNACEMLWVTDYTAAQSDIYARRVVAISARVHPGESNASFMMHGILDFLTGTSAEADALRRELLFLVVPMLNPDGVIIGNYRCSLAAVDLNRRWAWRLQPRAVEAATPCSGGCNPVRQRLHRCDRMHAGGRGHRRGCTPRSAPSSGSW